MLILNVKLMQVISQDFHDTAFKLIVNHIDTDEHVGPGVVPFMKHSSEFLLLQSQVT